MAVLMIKRRAFTLLEVIIAAAIFCIVIAGVYKLFIGGSKTADKGQWINGTIEQTRNALSVINTEISNSTYPTTMFKDKIYDPCDNKDKTIAAKYYLKILKNNEKIKVPDSDEIKIMEMYVCKAEIKNSSDGDSDGQMTKNEFYLEYKNKVGSSNLGNLVLKSETFTYKTNPQTQYAKSGKLNLKSEKNYSKILIEDVEFIEFTTLGNFFPSKDCFDFQPISVTIRTLYPKDSNVFKENSIMATPKVAIDLL